ncbi:uncharacterized protein LOC130591474 [Beta vulgaris subsp. vulgaris]|uniref:uncharacterized protein LOC130591474 n=1 Tax=Beta vulgaris subsp. vulgaris TaxID=3555 RepID=UPI0025480092|nr:uncharacterized protein LOC130591474 [Beta vulgaris subsp. vulgaris]
MVVRGLGDDGRCPMCGEFEESILHMLVLCEEAKWRLSPLRLEVTEVCESSFKAWCEARVGSSKDESWWALFWNVLWSIWLCRNHWVFNQKRTEVQEVVERAFRASLEYRDAQDRLSVGERLGKGLKAWQRPSDETLKVNVDAVVFDTGQVGYGGVVRDASGEVMVACCGQVDGGYEADVAEALAASLVLNVVWEAGIRHIIMESVCLKLIAHLKSAKVETTSFGDLVFDILGLASRFSSISFSHVGRDGNKVAHNLAQLSRSFMETRVWIAKVPREVQTFVVSDLCLVE